MKTSIVAIAILVLSLVACAPAAPIPVVAIEPVESVNKQFTGQSQLPSSPHDEEHLAQGGTLTSEYVPGSTPSASFEAFVSARELSHNGVEFTPVSLSELSSLPGPFAYISRKCDQNTTIYTMDVFTNHLVAEYEATQVEALNLFLVKGDKTLAEKNMALWCQAQGPQSQEEIQAGTNRVICFGFSEVE
jgi:hypothetical protein